MTEERPAPSWRPLYLTARDGVTYRVHDVRFGPDAGLPPHRRRAETPPHWAANYRWFITRDGVKRVYQRRPDDDWYDLSARTLQRQLDASGYAGRSRFDAHLHGGDPKPGG